MHADTLEVANGARVHAHRAFAVRIKVEPNAVAHGLSSLREPELEGKMRAAAGLLQCLRRQLTLVLLEEVDALEKVFIAAVTAAFTATTLSAASFTTTTLAATTISLPVTMPFTAAFAATTTGACPADSATASAALPASR